MGAETGARAFNLKLLSENVPDVSSIEALLGGIIKPGMTDEEKCKAVWRVVYEHRFWRPSSCGKYGWGGTDPILNLNCFAPTICQQDSEMLCGLWTQLGYDVRMWQLGWHTTSEVHYGGSWRHFDATMGQITKVSSEGDITSVTERHKRKGYRKWMRDNSYVSHSEGYLIGHSMGMTFRRGESFTRYWRPLSKERDYWVPASNGRRPEDGFRRGKSRMAQTMKLKPRRFEAMPSDAAYGNGVWTFKPDLAMADWKDLTEESVNVTVARDRGGAWLQPIRAGRGGHVIFRIRSPYIISGGWVRGKAAVAQGGEVKLLVSTTGGATWKNIWSSSAEGGKIEAPLREAVSGKIDWLLKIELSAPRSAKDARFGDLAIETIVQLNPFTLPALKLGETEVTVAAGEQIDRLTIIPNLGSPGYRDYIVEERNVVTAREGDQETWVNGICAKEPDKEAYVVFKVKTPGPMKRVRWGGRFQGGVTSNKLYYSLDGKTWKEKAFSFGQALKEVRNVRRGAIANYETLDSLPEGTDTVWLKYWTHRKSPLKERCHLYFMRGLRIDADYATPHAGKSPLPCDVTYCWTEFDGDKESEKTHTEKIASYPHSYKVRVAGTKEPIMKWVRMQLTDPK